MLLPTSKLFQTTDFKLSSGLILDDLHLAYETYGVRNAAGDNGILLCHGYTSSPHAAGDDKGWWHNLVGPGRAIDTDKYFVVCANMLGSTYGSTGPASIDPAIGKPYGLDFPEITTADMVAAQNLLLNYLGCGELAAVIGFSYGGFLTFEWGARHPNRMRALVPVATGISRRGDHNMILQMTDRFEKCSGWNGGQYYDDIKGSGVYDLLIEIREETLRNYGVEDFLLKELGDAKAAAAQLRQTAKAWAEEFDANSLIVLRKASMTHDVEPRAGNIKAPLLYVLSRTDALFPPSLAEPTMTLLKDAGINASYHELDSEYGHRGPTSDWQGWAPQLQAFLDKYAAR